MTAAAPDRSGNRVGDPGLRRTMTRRWLDFLEYSQGALWLLPALSGLVALLLGWILSSIDVATPGPRWRRWRSRERRTTPGHLLIVIAGDLVTVIAAVLGLTVVALQLSSTQFSPRLLRNFLRDRPDQVGLAVSSRRSRTAAAGLYTVGVGTPGPGDRFPAARGHRRGRTALRQPRRCSSSSPTTSPTRIQIDAIMHAWSTGHPRGVRGGLRRASRNPSVPTGRAGPVLPTRSGYVQTVHPDAAAPRSPSIGVTLA